MALSEEDDPRFKLQRAEESLHIYRALVAALDHLQELVPLLVDVGEDLDVNLAYAAVSALLGVDELQARAILDMQLRRLIGYEQPKIRDERRRLEDLCEELRREIRG